MKKLLNLSLLLTSLIGYLEWGKDNHAFIFQTEAELILKAKDGSLVFLHPFILIPFCGQLMLLITVFQQKPNRALTLIGLAFLSMILLFLFFIGLISLNIKILSSTIPFIITGIFVLKYNWRQI